MERFKALSTGTKLVLAAGPLLFISLFMNWQNLRIDYGRAGIAIQPQDGWDAWGLLIALLVAATVTLVVISRMTEVEMSEDVPWDKLMLGLGAATFAVAIVKNLTDADSTWASYVFVALAGVMAFGTYLNSAEARTTKNPLLGRKRRWFSSAA
jgi:peptidoglycan/LPS O-acetylase OafA/YrhL